jgi:hypothetical protein
MSSAMRCPPKAPALLFTALVGLPACSSTYKPRPSPRIAIVLEHGQPALVKGGERYEIGVFGGGLVDAVEGNAAAEDHAETFRNRTITGFAMSLGGVAFALGGASLLAAGAFDSRDPADAMVFTGAAVAFTGFGLMIASLFVTMSAPPHLWDAINVYNDAVTPPQLWPPPRNGWPVAPPGALAPIAPPPATVPMLSPAPPPAPAPPPP